MGPRRLFAYLPLLLGTLIFLLPSLSFGQECSATNHCATGCCSEFGFCGTTESHCGAGCQSTCDFRLGCDEDNPCQDGTCCSKFGFCGLGPDYCSTENCVAGCDAKSYCDPGGFGPAHSEVAHCPLNVCCSKWGWCGVTEEFCGTQTIQRPSCAINNQQPMQRVVGYYEGWAPGRPCDKFQPEDIPPGVYTHLNFAFASIDPVTFKVVPVAAGDPDLYVRLTNLKRTDPALKVFIAIGGWTFNDPGPTATTFSDIARSEANQRVFISSLISFMNTYDFDGVDIDWEYPEAEDRSGRGEDFGNFPIFMRNLKNALAQNGARNGLSITIPASYWYLQHFDIKKLADSVDFFSLMSYDLHGTWDSPTSWLGNHLNSHTNLTEIKDALDLLWRNDINPDQVVLGLAFYTRTFTASDPNCMEPGCLFDSGSPAGRCSGQVGVLTNSEVLDLVERRRVTPTLEPSAAVKIFSTGRDWITYDDGDSWALKVDFARSQCLGGVMVWAVSQDRLDGTFSKQLQTVTKHASRSVTTWTDPFRAGVVIAGPSDLIPRDQCRWTNCGDGCPRGWKAIVRVDKNRNRDDEVMLDGTGCPTGIAGRRFCCPPGPTPKCGWYNHKGGKCDPQCPSGQSEIASLGVACNNGKTQVACCETGEDPNHPDDQTKLIESMQVWAKCRWYGKEPDCTLASQDACAWDSNLPDLLIPYGATRGSGAQHCPGNRPYCCDTIDRAAWDGCGWYAGYGPWSVFDEPGTCRSGCPDNKVKVTVSDFGQPFCPIGEWQAYCCYARYETPARNSQEKEDRLKELLGMWAADPVCPADNGQIFHTRSTPTLSGNVSVVRRQGAFRSAPPAAERVLTDVLRYSPGSELGQAKREMWDEQILGNWPHLDGGALSHTWGPTRMVLRKMDNAARSTLCDIEEYEDMARGGELVLSRMYCNINTVGMMDPTLLGDPDDGGTDDGEDWAAVLIDDILHPFPGVVFARDGGRRKFKIICGQGCDFYIFSEPYVNGADGNNLAAANGDNRRFFVSNGNACGYGDIDEEGDDDDGRWVSEHILELQTIRDFMQFTIVGHLPAVKLPSGLGLLDSMWDPNVQIESHIWRNQFVHGFDEWWDRFPSASPMEKMFKALGSKDNPHDMVNCEEKLNGMKARIWGLKEHMAIGKWRAVLKPNLEAAGVAGATFDLIFGVWKYLRHDGIKNNLIHTHVAVADVLADFEAAYIQDVWTNTGRRPRDLNIAAWHWRDFMALHVDRMVDFSKAWMAVRTKELVELWTNRIIDLTSNAKLGQPRAQDIVDAQTALDKFLQYRSQVDILIHFDHNLFQEN